MKVGTTLPQFRDDAEQAIAAAQQAEDLGLDGAFVFDHLWPLGNPNGSVLHSHALLGALGAETRRIQIGALVARVGLLPDAVLANTLASQAHVAGRERVIGGVGAGDHLSRPENEAFGVAYESKARRVAAVANVCRLLRERGVTSWVGGRSPEIRQVAAETADSLNIWGASAGEVVSEVEDVRRRSGRPDYPVSWGSQVLIGRTDAEAEDKVRRYGLRPHLVYGTVAAVARQLDALAETGVTYVVCAPLDVNEGPGAYETLAEVKGLLT